MPVYGANRLEVKYRSDDHEHTMGFFQRQDASKPLLIGAVRAWLLDQTDKFYATTVFYGATWQVAGQAFSLLEDWEEIAGDVAGAPTGQNETLFLGFYGRSTAGRRFGVRVFGTNAAAPEDFRYQVGESVAVDQMLSGWSSVCLRAGDRQGNPGQPYNYVNVKFSAYWQSAQRT